MIKQRAVYNAAHLLYSLYYADEVEERGETFGPGASIGECVDRLPDSELAPVVWRLIGKIEGAIGADLGLIFHHAGFKTEEKQTDVLCDLFLGCAGHGVSIADDTDTWEAWNRGCDAMRVPDDRNLRRVPVYTGGDDWRDLAINNLEFISE